MFAGFMQMNNFCLDKIIFCLSLPAQRVTLVADLNLRLVERDTFPLFFFAHTGPRAEKAVCRRKAVTPRAAGGGGGLCAGL